MFSVRVFVAQNICLLYLSISSCILMLCKFLLGGGNLEFLGGNLSPPEVPRINPGRQPVPTYIILICQQLSYCCMRPRIR